MKELSESSKLMQTINYSKEELYKKFVDHFRISVFMYERLQDQMAALQEQVAYSPYETDLQMKVLKQEYVEIFRLRLVDLAHYLDLPAEPEAVTSDLLSKYTNEVFNNYL